MNKEAEKTNVHMDKIDESLPMKVGKLLIEKNISIASAESCTGGMFAASITDVPGISAVFDRGIVTYSNEAKMQELGVRKETLDKYGAVSEETAIEMAEGIRRVANTGVGVSVTGIAGPGGATPGKPVGLIYVCAVMGDKRSCRELRLTGDRSSNRNVSMLTMYNMVEKLILE